MSPLATKPAKPAPQRTNASAATGCYNFSCTGQDPQAMGCSADGQTIDELTYNGVRYELRLSNNCYAAWTRVTSPGWSNFDFGQIRGGDADFYAIYGVQVDTGQVWTKMIAFHYWVQACQSGWFDGAPNACTASH